MNTDESVLRQGKNHGLVNCLAHRKSMISALECVDFVVEFDEDTPLEMIKKIRPDVLVKGSDHPNPVGSDLVGDVFNFDLIPGLSTTSLIEKIRSAD
jgi:D-beta-D-heptose 7-phosphate kinase/D-beta-D-heptose 1-phosphate adenosyltransferase